MYREFKQLHLPTFEEEVLQFWVSERIFEQSVEQRSPERSFVFYEGPPSANGMPGIHHVISRTIKDLFCRYQTLKGFRVERKAGWDTHGLPVELQVEKELGITKEDIGKKVSIEEYNQACRAAVMRYKDRWEAITRRMGYWVDMEHPYVTFDNDYIESIWWLLKQLYQKRTPKGESFLYKGFTIQPFSPAAGTGLSSHELNMPGTYKDVTDISVVAMFRVRRDATSAFLFDADDEEVRILAWTTTPWTLPSNVALTVGPTIRYVKVKTLNPYSGQPVSVVLAEERLPAYFSAEDEGLPWEAFQPGGKKLPWRRAGAFPGQQLVGMRYEQLLPIPAARTPLLEERGFRVISGDWVTTEDGTGVVHTAPYFGADDFRACKEAGVPFIGLPNPLAPDLPLPLVDRQGRFVEEVPEFGGRYVKAEYYPQTEQDAPDFKPTDLLIALRLKADGKAFRIEKYRHPYPHCWRTSKPVLYYPLDSWFIRSSAMKERMVELNKTIRWRPESTGTGRFGQWLENLQDWNLSRSRFWGTPLPIWRTADGQEEICIGSIEELRAEIEKANRVLGTKQTVPSDLHRPFIDEVVLVAPSGRPMHREPDLIDVWFDSGAMPYAQWHYPFENQDILQRNFPADFIAEGVDQTRGWFYTLHAISTMVFDSVAFRTVVSNGLVLDKNGEKMSKSKGNVVDPFEIIRKHGADAARWYMMSSANPWENLRFDEERLVEVRNQFFGTLYNTYAFFALYANVDGFRSEEHAPVPLEQRTELDRWVLSCLHTLIEEYRQAMDDYDVTRACRLVEYFLDEHLSNWYVRLSRRRFWKGQLSADKVAAYQTLFECLITLSQLVAPIAPFFADWVYRNLTAPTHQRGSKTWPASVHLTDLAQPDSRKIDRDLERRMDYARRICSLALSIRKREKLRVRLPLQRLLLPVLDERFQAEVESVKDYILSEINVKQIEYVTDASGLLKKAAKANFKTLGARLGKHMKEAATRIAHFSQADINTLEKSGAIDITIENATYTLTPEDVIITAEDLPGWKTATDGTLTVALDVMLTPELHAEGIARDLVNRIQNLRKDLGLNVTDRVRVEIENHPAVLPAVEKFRDYIQNEVLATEVALHSADGGTPVVLEDDVLVRIRVEAGR